MTREDAERRWGPSPMSWPAWNCMTCSQRNSGWALECGRCSFPRAVAVAPQQTQHREEM